MPKSRSFSKRLEKVRSFQSRPSNDHTLAFELAMKFCDLNDIEQPTYSNTDTLGGGRGEYHAHTKTVYVDSRVCRWSWWSKPGNKADVTTFGVVAHELGHHIHEVKMGGWKYGLRLWMTAGNHRSITRYADRNVGEQLAEAARLFILNPQLLEQLSPVSYDFFSTKLGLYHG